MTGIAHIHWMQAPDGTLRGYVGILNQAVFQIAPSPGLGGKWKLGSDLPDPEKRSPSGDDLETLKESAEDLLSEFVWLLGAIFPNTGSNAHRISRTGKRDAEIARAVLAVLSEDQCESGWREVAEARAAYADISWRELALGLGMTKNEAFGKFRRMVERSENPRPRYRRMEDLPMTSLGTRSVHCIDGFCDDCHSSACSCDCHGGEDEAIERDEWDETCGWDEA